MAIAKSHCKSIAVRLLAATNQMEWLLRRRNTEISDPLVEAQFVQEIQRIRQTHVPGLD
jgi:hypothetical protein